MSKSIVYRHPLLYELTMIGLYGRHARARLKVLADLIPSRATVLDLCCGPASIYRRYLRRKDVSYFGIDINPAFIGKLRRAGGGGGVADLTQDMQLPTAQYVMMQASLYQFLPDAEKVVNQMLLAARLQVIISEPVRNLATRGIPLLSRLAAKLDAGSGAAPGRFTESSLDALFERFHARIVHSFFIPGGREKVFILSA